MLKLVSVGQVDHFLFNPARMSPRRLRLLLTSYKVNDEGAVTIKSGV
jgi:hypothetical protein